MDTQNTARKYLWYDLITNLCMGLIVIINSLNDLIKIAVLKKVVSIAGLINMIVFIFFTIKIRRLINKYYDNDLNKMGISRSSVGDKDFQEHLGKAWKKLKLSDNYMRFDLIFTTITLLFMFFQIIKLNIRFEILFTLTIILEFGFIFNMALEYKFLQNMKGDNNNEEQKSPQVDKQVQR